MIPEFYNKKFTVITKEKISLDLPDYIVNFYGSYDKCYYDIKDYEISNDTFFNGHIIFNVLEKYQDGIEKVIESIIGHNILSPKNIYVTGIHHHGVDSKCYLTDSVCYCSSWVLPFVLNTSRTENNLYGEMQVHRITMNEIKIQSSI